MISLIVHWFVLFSVLKASLFEKLGKETESNAADCSKLEQGQCANVGACVWDDDTSACKQDPCLEKIVVSKIDGCSNGAACAKINEDSITWCVTNTRVADFASNTSYRCSLEWGEYKIVEYGICKTYKDCGPVSPVEVKGDTYYVCGEGTKPKDPCVSLNETVCPYVGLCMWEGGSCVEDPCWEATYVSADKCKDGCTPFILNAGGTPQLGYCKSPNHDLHNPCNVGTATNIATKLVVCEWAASKIPSECKKTTTISKFDGDDLYICDPEEQTFKVDSASSLNSLLVAISTLALMIVML